MHLRGYLCIMVWQSVQQVRHVGWPEKNHNDPGSRSSKNNDYIKRYLQACQFNARFMFDTATLYAELTQPSRKLTKRNASFNNRIMVPGYQVNHASQALTPFEKNYSQTGKESLAQSWGMTIHRYYLLGIPFDSNLQWQQDRECKGGMTPP